MAARFLSNYVGVKNPSSPLSILCAGADSIRVIYGIACLFRGLINGLMEALENGDCSVLYRNMDEEDDGDDTFGDYSPVFFENITLAHLIPAKTKQVKAINKFLVLTEGEFKSIHKDDKESNSRINGGDDYDATESERNCSTRTHRTEYTAKVYAL